MKRVWSGGSLHDTTHFQNVLEHAGIGSVIKNRELGGGLGDLPVLACAPELWVLRDEQAARAEALLREVALPARTAGNAAWRCPECAADNEAQFAACWRCGRADDEATA